MANMTIRDLPENTKKTLRIQAAQAGISLEAYARHILQVASSTGDLAPANILDLATHYFGPKYGVDIELPKRRTKRRSVNLDA